MSLLKCSPNWLWFRYGYVPELAMLPEVVMVLELAMLPELGTLQDYLSYVLFVPFCG